LIYNIMQSTTEQLKKIKDDVLASPEGQECLKNNTYPVIGEGSHTARVMLIGEAPGESESLTGRPFVGQAGKVLDLVLSKGGLVRSETYITNVIKFRPPDNRDPLKDEIINNIGYLTRQIDAIQPALIVCLGRFAQTAVFDLFGQKDSIGPITSTHGTVIEPSQSYKDAAATDAMLYVSNLKVMVTYHPAATLYNPLTLVCLEDDIKKVRNLI